MTAPPPLAGGHMECEGRAQMENRGCWKEASPPLLSFTRVCCQNRAPVPESNGSSLVTTSCGKAT